MTIQQEISPAGEPANMMPLAYTNARAGRGSVMTVPSAVARDWVVAEFSGSNTGTGTGTGNSLPDARVVHIVGSPLIRSLPYAALRTVITSLTPWAPSDSEPALVTTQSGVGLSPTPLAVVGAFVRMLSAASEDAPVVIVVENVDQIDSSSRDVFYLCEHRLTADSVVIVLGTPPEPTRHSAISTLGTPQARVCLAVALDGSWPAIAQAYGDAAPLLVSELQTVGMVEWRNDDQLGLSEFVSASGVLTNATVLDRQNCHRELAEAHRRLGDDDRALHHDAAATGGTDESVAERLADFAQRAWNRGARRESIDALQRAIALTSNRSRKQRWTMDRADRQWNCGDAQGTLRSLSTLNREELPLELALRYRVLIVIAAQWERTPSQVSAEVRAGAHIDEPVNKSWAAWAYVFLANNSYLVGNIKQGVMDAERAVALADESGDVLAGLNARGNLEWNLCLAGQTERPGGSLDLNTALAVGRMAEHTDGPDYIVAPQGVLMIAAMEERWDDADQLLAVLPAIARRRGLEAGIRLYDGVEASMLWRRGRLEEAVALSVEICSAPLQPRIARALGDGQTAHYAACAGDLERAETLATASLAVGVELRVPLVVAVAEAAFGHARLSEGNIAAAVRHFDKVAVTMRGMGFADPCYVFWAGDALEAWVEAGHDHDVQVTLDELAPFAASGRRWVRGVMHRAEALRAADLARAEEFLASSASAFDSLGMAFERARTELARARVQQRFGVPGSDATFASAERMFRTVGARSWVTRTNELAKRADQPESSDVQSFASQLSAAELRVARVVAGGATNKETSEQLCISAKTVEYHLQAIYRKLQIRNRAQLVVTYLGAIS